MNAPPQGHLTGLKTHLTCSPKPNKHVIEPYNTATFFHNTDIFIDSINNLSQTKTTLWSQYSLKYTTLLKKFTHWACCQIWWGQRWSPQVWGLERGHQKGLAHQEGLVGGASLPWASLRQSGPTPSHLTGSRSLSCCGTTHQWWVMTLEERGHNGMVEVLLYNCSIYSEEI